MLSPDIHTRPAEDAQNASSRSDRGYLLHWVEGERTGLLGKTMSSYLAKGEVLWLQLATEFATRLGEA